MTVCLIPALSLFVEYTFYCLNLTNYHKKIKSQFGVVVYSGFSISPHSLELSPHPTGALSLKRFPRGNSDIYLS